MGVKQLRSSKVLLCDDGFANGIIKGEVLNVVGRGENNDESGSRIASSLVFAESVKSSAALDKPLLNNTVSLLLSNTFKGNSK